MSGKRQGMLMNIKELRQQYKLNVKPGETLARCHISVAHSHRRWKAVPPDFYPSQSDTVFWGGSSMPCYTATVMLLSATRHSEIQFVPLWRQNQEKPWENLTLTAVRNARLGELSLSIPDFRLSCQHRQLMYMLLEFILILKPSIFDA